MTQPRFADAAAPNRSLTVVTAEDWPALRETHPAKDWLTATGFEAGLGELRLIPGTDGVGSAIAGLGTAKARSRLRFGLAKAVAGLPAGNWALEGNLTQAQKDEATLAWLLQGYRFDHYRFTKAADALLRLPDGVNGARILAVAEGEFLTRDLVNTPASDMGPEELESAFVALAQRFEAATTIIRGDDLLTQNFPMVHAVGRASPRAPRIMDMRWEQRPEADAGWQGGLL